MTRTMWTNRHDTECWVVSGPGRWHRCAQCGTRWRALGRYVRRTTRGYRCPGCELGDRRMPYSRGARVLPLFAPSDAATMSEADPGATRSRPLTKPDAQEASRNG